jgi:Cu/Ag efflux pump CusA
VESEMANLPGVQEIRSILKIQLSVVTIVFDDDITYLPRQLIAEKIKSASIKSQLVLELQRWGLITVLAKFINTLWR